MLESNLLSEVKKTVSAPEVKPEPKKQEPVKQKEVHEKYFEFFAGSEEKAKPFLDFFKDLKNHKSGIKDELLQTLVTLVSKTVIPREEKLMNVIPRLLDA